MTAAPSDPLSILVVDDETIVRESLGAWFREEGHRVEMAESGAVALRRVAEQRFDLAVIDVKMPNMDGMELQARLAEAVPDLTVIVMTAYASVQTAVQALKAGAYDYLVKPFDPEDLSRLVRRVAETRSLRRENQLLKQSLDAAAPSGEIVAESAAMRGVLASIAQVAPTDATVLVLGRSGTGKELVARALHAASPRRYGPLVAVHCGALAEGVLESELFGHEKGAFTGAAQHHKGKFEQADGGTIFLDEIGDVSPRVQVELLRVLEEKKVTRVGGKQAIPVDFRVVAATNRDLRALVEAEKFREDLWWRLNVVTITIPPLSERPEDVVPLARHFLARLRRSMNVREMDFAPDALEAIRAHTWPGNVRELLNAVERAVVLGTPPLLRAHDLPIPSALARAVPAGPAAAAAPAPAAAPATPAEVRTLADLERWHVARVLEETGWNVSKAASVLDVDRGTLYHKIQKFGLAKPAHAT